MTAIDETTTTTFSVNGEPAVIHGDHPHLLAALRDELGLISPKDGCAPSGQCGCCTILLDGKAVVACQVSLERASGKSVVTLEGVDPAERDRYAQAFGSCGALQCGFCTPGIIMRTKGLIDKKGRDLTRDDAARHLGANLCRCTGYVKILDAVEALAQETPVEVRPSGGIGTSGARYEAEPLSLGDRPFIDDMDVPGMLHAALALADHARAEVLAIDTGAAQAEPGVVAAFTAADIPGELRVGIIHTDWPVMIPVGGRTSYLGDVLAVVVAETRQAARRAAALVEVEYRPLRPLTDPVAAIDDAELRGVGHRLQRAVACRPTPGAATPEPPGRPAAHRVHEVFQTQRIEHAFLEPESTLAVPQPDGTLHVYSGGQGVWDDRNQIASVLGVDTDQVTVELVSNGGAFGGKEDMSNQAHAALAAFELGRPVKCTLTREQSLLMHPKRHPIRLEYRAGCDADGTLTVVEARMIGDSGSYASVGMKVLERAAGHASGPYRVPVIDVEAIAVRTNNPACGAFRGFGANQAQFAMEGVMDRLAEMVGLSGLEMRRRNVIRPGAGVGPGPDHGRRLRRGRPLPRRHRAGLRGRPSGRPRRGPGPGPQELGAGQRLPGDRQGGGALPRRRPHRGAPLLDRDGPGHPLGGPPGGGDRAGGRPRAHRGAGRHHPRAGRRPDHRQPGHGDGSRVGGRRLPGCAGRRLSNRGRLRGRVPSRLDQQDLRRASSTRSSTRPSATPPSWSSSTATPARSPRWWPCTTWARPSTRCCAKARSTGPCTWGWATPCPRTSRPTSRAGRTNMTLKSLGIIRPKDMPAGRGHPGRGAPAPLALRHQGGGRDRAGADGGSGGRRPARPRRPVAQPPPHAPRPVTAPPRSAHLSSPGDHLCPDVATGARWAT